MPRFRCGHTEVLVTSKTRRYVNVRPGDDPIMSEADTFAVGILTYVGLVGLLVSLASVVLIVVLGGWAVVALLVGMVALGALYIRYGLDPVDGQLEARKLRKLAKRNPQHHPWDYL